MSSRCRLRSPFEGSPEFLRLIRGESFLSLPRIALEIARDVYPRLDINATLARIEPLAERVRQRIAPDAKPKTILGQVNWVLYVEEGYRGNDGEYYDPRNSYLNEVLDRKTGIPITLSILYAAVAEQVGVQVSGVNLPAHFMLRLDTPERPLFVDAFDGGAFLSEKDCRDRIAQKLGSSVDLPSDALDACSPAVTVARVLRNLKAIHLHGDDLFSALPVARRLAALEPDNLFEMRDWGLLAYRTGHPGEAVQPLSRFCEMAPPESEDREVVAAMLRAARRDLALSN